MSWRSLHIHAPTWVDGPVLDIMEAFRSGRVYQLDSLKTTPYTVLTHTPLSYLVGYGVYRLWPGFIALRAVNIIATLACASLIFAWVRKRTERLSAPMFAACAFVLMPAVFQWSQMTRSPDAICCFFALAALTMLDSSPGWTRQVSLGALLALAVLSKQTAILTLLPTLIVYETIKLVSIRSVIRSVSAWLLICAAILLPIGLGLQWMTHGGFSINIIDANICGYSLQRFYEVTQKLLVFWIFIAAVFLFSGRKTTPAHIWAIVALAVGLATCPKAGADTMYFFDASAAAAMLAGLAMDRAYGKVAAVLMAALVFCALADLLLTRITRPAVETGYRQMLDDLRPYPTVISDEASIDIGSGRAWYWGDPLVLNNLASSGRLDDSSILAGLATHRFAAAVVWNPFVWSPQQYGTLQREYRVWRTYPAFEGAYTVYLPR